MKVAFLVRIMSLAILSLIMEGQTLLTACSSE